MADTEIEYKFCLAPAQRKAVETAVRRGAVERTHLQARYFDTADNLLARNGIALRLRKEGRRWVQTVKASGSDSLQRLEHNVDLGMARAAAEPQPAPELHAGTPVGELLLQTLAASEHPLALTYETDVWRLTRLLRIPGGWVELAFDQGHVRAQSLQDGQPVSSPVLELELELVRGDIVGLTTLAQRWASRHGLWLSTVSKAEQGERLRAGTPRIAAVKAGPTRFVNAAPAGREILQRAIASCLAQILPNASEVASGSEDAEQIHQLRIGIRRLRTALRELTPLAPHCVDPGWLPPLVAVFRALGELRDHEEVIGGAQAQLLAVGGPPLELPPPPQQHQAAEVVRDSAFQQVLTALAGFVAEPAALPAAAVVDRPPAEDTAANGSEDSDRPSDEAAADPNGLDHAAALAYLRERLARLHAGTERAGKRFGRLTPEQRHTARKRLKRLRYLSEFAAGLFERRQVARYLERLRPAQDALGLYNDEVVALETWQQLTAHEPRAWFGVGWFSARHDGLVQHSARQLRRLRRAPRFWES